MEMSGLLSMNFVYYQTLTISMMESISVVAWVQNLLLAFKILIKFTILMAKDKLGIFFLVFPQPFHFMLMIQAQEIISNNFMAEIEKKKFLCRLSNQEEY